MSGRGWFEVSDRLLLEVLHAPPDTELLGAQVRWLNGNPTLRLLVEHEDLPDESPPPTYNPEITHHPDRYEWDWNA